jgi:hypothetical protein
MVARIFSGLISRTRERVFELALGQVGSRGALIHTNSAEADSDGLRQFAARDQPIDRADGKAYPSGKLAESQKGIKGRVHGVFSSSSFALVSASSSLSFGSGYQVTFPLLSALRIFSNSAASEQEEAGDQQEAAPQDDDLFRQPVNLGAFGSSSHDGLAGAGCFILHENNSSGG